MPLKSNVAAVAAPAAGTLVRRMMIDDYTNTTPGVWKIYGGVALSWTTSGNNSLTLSGGGEYLMYSYTVIGTTLTLTLNGLSSTFTKASVTVGGL